MGAGSHLVMFSLDNRDFSAPQVVTVEGFDTLHLGKKDSPVSSTNMTIWQVTKHELSFWKTGNAIFSGIVGLSHVKKIPEGAPNLKVVGWLVRPCFNHSRTRFNPKQPGSPWNT